MSKPETIVVYNIELETDQPTSFSFDQLYDWVIWQYAQKTESGLSGAVRPPLADAHWYPAIIQPKEKRVQIYGHLDTSCQSPEEASKLILNQLAISK
jgi:hypothetical protein